MSDRPIRSREWREYEITGRVDSDARMVFFGAILSGNGKSWWDGFHLRVKGEEGDWEDLDIQNPGFEEDTAGRIPGQWAGKSPGYNYIVQKNNPAEGQNCLLLESGSIPFKGKLFGEHPKIGEAVIKELDGGLSCRIPLALPGDEGGTWNAHKNGAFDTLVSKIESFDPGRHTAEREDVRLAGVTIAWNVFQHFYPYFDEAGVDWDAELTHALTEALADRDAEEFYATLSRMVAKLKDGHGNVMHESRFGLEGFPIRLEWIESKLVVTASQDPRHFRRGDIIRSIDGVEAEKALLEDEKLISGSSQWKRIQSCRRFGYGKSGTFARFVIKRGEDILSFEAERNFRGAVLEQKGPPIQELEKGVFYVDLDRAQWNVIRERIGTLAQAEGVICDMRGYPKGNHEIICHLLKEKDTSGAWMRIPQIIYPDREKIAGYHKMGWHLVPKEPHIKGKVAFVTDARAISYAESFLSFVEHYKLGEIIGGPTAGANGNVNPFSLPGGYTIAWTGMKVLKHDGTRHHLIGIQPTVPCERTIQGVREGRDELLAKALEVVR